MTAALALASTMGNGALASVPSVLMADGVLTAQGGGPVADGNYAVTFAIYKDVAGGAPVWSEGPLQVAVKNGAFSQALGTLKPVDAGVAAAGTWISLTVGADPELPRKPWRSVPFALRAQVAENLDCSGCVSTGAIDPQALAGYAKAADLTAYAKATDLASYAKTASLAKVATTGAYSDLIGLPVLAKVNQACGSGLVVDGLKADGSLTCVTAIAAIAGVSCAAGSAVTGFSAAGVPTCTAVADILGGGGSTTVYLEPAACGSHLTTATTCWALACDFKTGVTGYRTCAQSVCTDQAQGKCNTTLLGTLVVAK